jgi:hypothetical protein
VDGEMDSVHVKSICMKDLMSYVYIVIEDKL